MAAKTYKILIVDDVEDNRYSLKKVLQRSEYIFFEAEDAATSLALIKQEQPDLVLLDVRIPKIDGFQICETIRQFSQHLPIVFVTANMKAFVDQVKGFEKGGDEYIVQPFDPNELAIKVKALLRNKKLYDELLEEVQKLNRIKSELENKTEDLKHVNNKLVEKNEHLNSLTITDPLTQLYNRKYFHQRISKELSAVRRYKHEATAVMVDIDGFARINHEFGSAQADVILKEFASLLVNSVRNSDVVTRYDGARFAVIFTHTPEDNGLVKAKMIQEAVKTYPFPIYDDLIPSDKSVSAKSMNLTSSIILFELAHDWIKSEAEIIQAFEHNMKKAKAKGGGQLIAVEDLN